MQDRYHQGPGHVTLESILISVRHMDIKLVNLMASVDFGWWSFNSLTYWMGAALYSSKAMDINHEREEVGMVPSGEERKRRYRSDVSEVVVI